MSSLTPSIDAVLFAERKDGGALVGYSTVYELVVVDFPEVQFGGVSRLVPLSVWNEIPWKNFPDDATLLVDEAVERLVVLDAAGGELYAAAYVGYVPALFGDLPHQATPDCPVTPLWLTAFTAVRAFCGNNPQDLDGNIWLTSSGVMSGFVGKTYYTRTVQGVKLPVPEIIVPNHQGYQTIKSKFGAVCFLADSRWSDEPTWFGLRQGNLTYYVVCAPSFIVRTRFPRLTRTSSSLTDIASRARQWISFSGRAQSREFARIINQSVYTTMVGHQGFTCIHLSARDGRLVVHGEPGTPEIEVPAARTHFNATVRCVTSEFLNACRRHHDFGLSLNDDAKGGFLVFDCTESDLGCMGVAVSSKTGA